jgi:hypothetical protein
MRAIVVENGVIVNSIVVDHESPAWIITSEGDIGDGYVNGVVIPRPKEEMKAAIPDVSAVQIRKALTRMGLREQVESAVAAGSQDLKDEWEWSATFKRNHPSIEEMRVAIGRTQQEVDDLFLLAATL